MDLPPPPPKAPVPSGSKDVRPSRRPREFVIRRAWGTYFAIWAVALLAFLVIAGALESPGGGATLDRALLILILDLAIAISAGLVTLRHFRGVWGETHFPLWRVGMGFVVSFTILLAGLVFAALLPGTSGLLVLSGATAVVSLILLRQISWSLDTVPLEGLVAGAVLLIGSLGSAAVLLLTGRIFDDGAVWVLTVVVWFVCATYALTRQRPEILSRSPGVPA